MRMLGRVLPVLALLAGSLAAPCAKAADAPVSRAPARSAAECQIGVGPEGRPVVCMDAFLEVLWDHGTWVDSDRFGHLFCPDAASFGPDFRPFTDGHWVMTPEGWTFVGRHPTSWVTDHYGRWVQTGLPACRWGWVPGDVYAPAWVEFHVGESVIAWRPAPFDGVPVQLRVPTGVALQPVRLSDLPTPDPSAGFAAVRDGDLDSEKLGKVMLKGVDLYAALREVAPLRDAQVGLHSRTRGEVVAQIPTVRARREAALAAQGGAPPEPARRVPRGGASPGGAGGKPSVAGTVRTGKAGSEGRPSGQPRPGETPPGAGKVYWGGDQNQGGFTQPGPNGGAKVLEWGGPAPAQRPPAPVNLPPPSQRVSPPTTP